MQNPTFLKAEGSGEEIVLGVPLIRVLPKETPVSSEAEVTLMDVDEKAVPESVTVGLTDPTSTGGRDVVLPPSAQSEAPPDGPSEKKRRRVMFAD